MIAPTDPTLSVWDEAVQAWRWYRECYHITHDTSLPTTARDTARRALSSADARMSDATRVAILAGLDGPWSVGAGL